jgi:hypothetical protein
MDTERWLEDNNRYLAASLQWLRQRLHRLAEPQAAPPVAAPVSGAAVAPATAAAPVVRRGWFGRNEGARPLPAQPLPPAPAAVSASAPVPPVDDAALAAREAAAKSDPPPALLLLAQRLGLSAFERDTLLLCAAAELDPAMAALFAAAQGGGRSHPTFALALQLFDQPSWEALSPHRPLRYARLIEINQPGATPLTASALRADERIVNYLKGLNVLDERLAALLAVAGDAAPVLSASQQQCAEQVLQRLRSAVSEASIPVVQLVGADPGSKLAIAGAVCDTLGRRLYRLALEALPTHKAEVENLARLWQRESALLPVALYLDAENLDTASADLASAFHWFLSREAGLVFAGLREAPTRNGIGGYSVEARKPPAGEQCAAWLEALRAENLGEDPQPLAQTMAGQFNLNLQDIQRVMQTAAAAPAEQPLPQRIWDACRMTTQPRLDMLAQRLEPKATWSDLVLSDEALGLLRQIVGQVRGRYTVYEGWGYARKLNRGLGINALFAGESGTGKTMAAEVIANELRLALYRIDLSAVVSKYIGETEKNLRKLFDAAEAGGAILLFDEADALFGKRSEVKDSHDRYANIEINYLLQRMEAFSGLAILATNMKSALDNAFMRRLRFIVNFQFPGPAERKQIWQKALPPGVPCEALDYERLARFSLSGGNVASIVLNASFSAAQRGTPLTMPLLLSATRTELRKLDKPINEAEFR